MTTDAGELDTPAAPHPAQDAWGGLAAALVVLPSSIAFGVTAYAPLGAGFIAAGATAGIIGAVALGVVAPIFGGTPRLISTPCAPAAAVMAGLAGDLAAGAYGQASARPEQLVALMALVALLSGALQLAYGALGGGRLIKYIPYSVVSGYLTGAGLLLALGQLPKFLGLPKGTPLRQGLASPELWAWPALAVGAAAAATMMIAPRLTRRVPGPILALAAAMLSYLGLGLFLPGLLTLEHNGLVVGSLGVSAGSLISGVGQRWEALARLGPADVSALWKPALTLSLLLSIDTLKTCVALDAMTESRHDSNRELRGQGLANLASALAGGMPGAGMMGATLVNLNSGGATRLSGVFEGGLALAALLLAGGLIAWIPVAGLAGILIVVGARMADRSSLKLLRHRSTILDFLVIAAVVAVALFYHLIAAAGVGILLTVALFLRDQIRSRVLRRKSYGHQFSSKRRRLQEELRILERKGREVLLCELQGNLFFGTTDQLLLEIEPDLRQSRYAIFDMRRVHSVDFTAAHLLEQIRARLARKGGALLFTNLRTALPAGQDLSAYFKQLGVVGPTERAEVFPDLYDAVEWVENRLLREEGALDGAQEKPLSLSEFELLRGLSPETLLDLGTLMGELSFKPGQTIFEHGTPSGEIYLVRRGLVNIHLPAESGQKLHLATFGRGDFFGDLSFLNPGRHSADAVAAEPTDLYYTPRDVFDVVAREHHRLGSQFFTRLCETLGQRLRRTDVELRASRES